MHILDAVTYPAVYIFPQNAMIRQHCPSACTASRHETNSLTTTHGGDRDGRKRRKDKRRPTAQPRGGGGGHKMVTTLHKPHVRDGDCGERS